MISFLKKTPLPKQIGLGTLFAVSLVFIILVFTIWKLFDYEINEIVTDHQVKEVELIASQLSSEYQDLELALQKTAKQLKNELKDLQIENSGTNSPKLTLGTELINGHSDFIKDFAVASDIEVSLIYKNNNQFNRIASSIASLPAIIDTDNIALPALQNDNKYSGIISLKNIKYLALYSPIANKPNLLIELLLPYENIIQSIRESVKSMHFGKDGYVFVTEAGKQPGLFIIHPVNEGRNIMRSPELKDIFEKMYQSKSGVFYYTLQVEGKDSKPRDSKAIYQFVPGWNWVVTIKTYRDEYRAEINGILWIVAAISATGSILLTMMLWLIIRRSLKPLEEISSALNQLGQGNLAFRFVTKTDKDSKNEIDLLQNDAIRMRDNLIQLVNKIQHSSQGLLASTEAISKANADLRNSAHNSQDISLQVGTAITQISSAIDEVAQSASQVSEESKTSRRLTEAGLSSIKQVEKTVTQVSSAFAQAADTIQTLEHSSKNIEEVVTVINNIAEQTNLLALNAAIEAARAGEQGRGFAVVADEVRVLAQRTQQSTEEIRKVVDSLQHNSRSAVKDMEHGKEQVENSVKETLSAGNLLEQIFQSIQAVEMRINNVATATEEQSVAATQIRGNSEGLQESALGTLNQANTSEQHSEHIHNLALGLQKDLSAFTLK